MRPKAELLRPAGRHQDRGRRAVRHLRGVARGDDAVRGEGGLELGEGGEVGVPARTLVRVEGQRLAVEGHRERDDLVLEPPGVDGGHGLAVRVEREAVGGLAVDPVLPRHVLGRDPHAEVGVGVACRSASGWATSLWPPIGMRLIDSVPPATITSASPASIARAARAIACRPDAQKRLTVMAAAAGGIPARRAACRATFIPCSASGIAQPRMTSSTISGVSAGTRASAALMAAPAMSSGRVWRSVPLGALPTAVRTLATITASRGTVPWPDRRLQGLRARRPRLLGNRHGSASSPPSSSGAAGRASACAGCARGSSACRGARGRPRARGPGSPARWRRPASGPRRTGSWPRGWRGARRAR